MSKLSVDSGAVILEVEDIDGEALGVLKFRPSDPKFLERFIETQKFLDELPSPDGFGVEELIQLNRTVSERFDYLLGYKISDTILDKCGALSLCDDGRFFCMHLLSDIGEFIKEETEARVKKTMEQVEAATAEYNE